MLKQIVLLLLVASVCHADGTVIGWPASSATCDNTTDAVLDGVGSGTTDQNNISININVSQAVTLNAGEVVTGFQTMVQGTGFGSGSFFIALFTDNSGEPGTEIADTRAVIAYSSLNSEARELEELLLAANYTVTTTGTYYIVMGGVGGDAVYGTYRDATTLGDSRYTTDGGESWYELSGEDYRVEALGCD